VARIRGTGDGPSLMLLSHTDVVLADPSEWSVPPFSGEVRDDEARARADRVYLEALASGVLEREYVFVLGARR
jgi:acetylornithine deacetylase/succinyl-diaminopimelate desuccinylase-like protein